MSNIYKTIIPLIDENISLDDIQDDTFIDCYLEDKNRPFLDNHIFLMYEWGDKKSTKVFYKFRNIKSFYGYKIIYIGGKSYIIYTFTSNKNIKHLRNGNILLGSLLKLRILRFWQFTDKWVTFNIMRGTVMCDPPSNILPEEDYIEE